MRLKCKCGWEGNKSEGVEYTEKHYNYKQPRYDHTLTTYNGCPKCEKRADIPDDDPDLIEYLK